MSRILLVVTVVLTVLLIAAGTLGAHRAMPSQSTPDGAVRALFEDVGSKNWKAAYDLLSNKNAIDLRSFIDQAGGSNGDLRTVSTIAKVTPKILRESDTEAQVRADLQWTTAVGAIYGTRDLKVVKDGKDWKVEWPVEQQAKVPPQVIPVNFLRWDIVTRGADDDWGSQNVDAPRVRIVSMNAIADGPNTIIVGEIENEDTVPGFVAVGATLIGKSGDVLGEETSFDKISHTMLPKEISPFRIDFPKVKLAAVKSVRMTPNSMLVPASADPVIGVLHQRVETDTRGRHVLKGELLNESGVTVNIPHVLATYYDASGKVIWVSDGYVDNALLPQTPVPFAVDLRNDLASNVHNYRVTVNQYMLQQDE